MGGYRMRAINYVNSVSLWIFLEEKWNAEKTGTRCLLCSVRPNTDAVSFLRIANSMDSHKQVKRRTSANSSENRPITFRRIITQHFVSDALRLRPCDHRLQTACSLLFRSRVDNSIISLVCVNLYEWFCYLWLYAWMGTPSFSSSHN